MKFDKKLLSAARAKFYAVYVDKYDENGYFQGSETATEGDRIRIYPTFWNLEKEIIVHDNSELEQLIKSFDFEK